MEKLQYLVMGRPEPDDELRRRLLEEVAPALAEAGATGLGVDVHDSAAAEAPSPVPPPADEDVHVAVVSAWLPCHDRRGPLEDVLATLGRPVHGYLVLESLYTDYGESPHAGPRSWPDGERSPGVSTVCLIHAKPGLGHGEFLRRWHGTHSPVSAEVQPRCRYVRNEVVRPLTAGAPEVHGIVEEAWPSAEVVADPMRFYCGDGDPERMEANLGRMMDSVLAFLDLGRLRNVTMSEYLLGSPGRR